MSDTTGEKLMYKLNAVLVHSGMTCNSGHYYAYVRNSNRCWFRMDDDRVSSSGLHQVLTQNAYILFYIRSTGSPKPASMCVSPVTSLNHTAVRTPTPVPSLPKIPRLSLSNSTAGLPRPFAESNGLSRNSLLAPAPPAPKGPKLICEPVTIKKTSIVNGNSSNHVPLSTAVRADINSNNLNKSVNNKNLVPYSDDEDDDNDDGDDNDEVKKPNQFTSGQTIGSHNNGTVENESQKSTDLKPDVPIQTIRTTPLTNGSKAAHGNGYDLMRLQNQTLQSFGSAGK